MKKQLAAQPPAATLADRQAQPDAFTACYTTRQPHKSLPHRATPATIDHTRPKASPGDRAAGSHDRVRTNRTGKTGCITRRPAGQLYHTGTGRTHAGTRILLPAHDLHVRIIDAATGELLRELTPDPTRNYQPAGRPPGPKPRTPRPA